MKFNPGDRIRISTKYSWAQGSHGTIAEPPEFAKQLAQDNDPWEGWHRLIQGVNRIIEFFWINFDEPQFDADGDGPYASGEIEAEMIELV